MISALNDLIPVLIESPYDLLDQRAVRELFSKLIALKIEGFREVYPYGVLPVDTYDFIATHHLICQRRGDELHPIAGYKSITLDRCNLHRLPLPGFAVLGASGAREHLGALQQLIEEASARGGIISYESSWTIDPKLREDPELKKLVKELIGAIGVSWEREIGSVLRVTCGVPKVKSDQFFASLGYERVKCEGAVLPPFEQNSLLGEEAVLLKCEKYSTLADDLVSRYRFFVKRQERYRSVRPGIAAVKKAA